MVLARANLGSQPPHLRGQSRFADLFGITSNLGKVIFGAVAVGGFFAIGGFLVHALYRRYNAKNYQRKSLLQYSILMVFFLTMIGLPIKMLLRLMFHIKYVWITPWFNV